MSRDSAIRLRAQRRLRVPMLLAAVLVTLPAQRAGSEPWGAPALITHPTAASRADLERAVAHAFGGAHVRLADDALTRRNLLIVGQAQARDTHGLPLNGRVLGRPPRLQHFRLLRRGTRCVLLHVETGKLHVLTHTTCKVLPVAHR